MNHKVYRISGYFIIVKIDKIGKKEGKSLKRKIIYRFSKELLAESKEKAIEYLYSIFGGVYKIKKHQINIENIEEISFDEVRDKKLRSFLKSIS